MEGAEKALAAISGYNRKVSQPPTNGPGRRGATAQRRGLAAGGRGRGYGRGGRGFAAAPAPGEEEAPELGAVLHAEFDAARRELWEAATQGKAVAEGDVQLYSPRREKGEKEGGEKEGGGEATASAAELSSAAAGGGGGAAAPPSPPPTSVVAGAAVAAAISPKPGGEPATPSSPTTPYSLSVSYERRAAAGMAWRQAASLGYSAGQKARSRFAGAIAGAMSKASKEDRHDSITTSLAATEQALRETVKKKRTELRVAESKRSRGETRLAKEFAFRERLHASLQVYQSEVRAVCSMAMLMTPPLSHTSHLPHLSHLPHSPSSFPLPPLPPSRRSPLPSAPTSASGCRSSSR